MKSVQVSAKDPEIRRQLRDQRKWLRQQAGSYSRAAFLIPEFISQQESAPKELEGFTPVLWADVCAELRMMVSELRGRCPMTTLRLILGFVGAVEQNVLDYPRCDQIPQNVGLEGWRNLVDHLANALRSGESHATRNIVESFQSRADFLANVSLYQLYFNLARPNSYNQGLTPWQIIHQLDPRLPLKVCLLPPILLDYRLTYCVETTTLPLRGDTMDQGYANNLRILTPSSAGCHHDSWRVPKG